jgi:sulfur dioxygenase
MATQISTITPKQLHAAKLPEDTFVNTAHEYNGMTVNTIGEEKRHNTRLQVSGKQTYIDQMNALELEDPRLTTLPYPPTAPVELSMQHNAAYPPCYE